MRIGTIGVGIIGSSWAVSALRSGHEVVVHDSHQTLAEMERRVERVVVRASPDGGSQAEVVGRIRIADSLEDVAAAGCGYIQESIAEDLAEKQALFERLDALVDPDTILASSSSALPASRIMGALAHRERCIISHPATPPHLLPAVEVVPAPFTAASAVARTEAILRALGQKPVLLGREIDGFVMNRLQGVLLLEMLSLIKAGVVTPEGADTLIRDAFGIRWSILGPLEGVHLNAPAGVADYFSRYRPMFERLQATRDPATEIFDDAFLEQLQAYCAESVPVERIEQRREWRDERFDEIAAWRKGAGLA